MSLGLLCTRLLVLSISVSLLSFGLTAGSYHPLAYEPAFADDGDRAFTYSMAKITGLLQGGPDLDGDERFGSSVANIGDIDGDGTDDIAVGASYDGTGGTERGAIHIIMLNSNGTPKQTVKIANGTHSNSPALSDYDYFGSSVANIGDIDGDGTDDIAVGALGDGTGDSYRGAIHIIMLNSNGTPKQTVKIANGTHSNSPALSDYDYFGSSVANIGDIDGDGTDDIAVGAYGDETGGSDRGAVHIINLS